MARMKGGHKYGKKMTDTLCELISSGKYKMKDIFEMVGITHVSFYTWMHKPEFRKRIEAARDARLESLKEMAVSGLATLLEGKEYEEVTTEYVGRKDADGMIKPVLKFQRKTKKYIMPNPTSVIFALKNLDSKNFKDVYRTEMTGKDGEPLIPKKDLSILTDEEVEAMAAIEAKLEAANKKRDNSNENENNE